MKVPAKIIAPLILLALAALCSYSYLEADKNSPYPGVGGIRSNYESYVGKRVAIFGDVTMANGDTATVFSGGLSFTVRPLRATVGDKAEVLGILGEDYKIAVIKALSYNRMSYYAIFLRSLAGAGLLAFFFLKNWTPDAKKLRFKERS